MISLSISGSRLQRERSDPPSRRLPPSRRYGATSRRGWQVNDHL